MPATTTTATAAFEVGATYDTGHGDYVWRFEVIARTAKFLTIRDIDGDGSTTRVGVTAGYHGHEIALPLGRYSMAPVMNADRPA